MESFILDPVARTNTRESLSEDKLAEFAYLASMLCVESIRRRDLESSSLPEIHVFARALGPHARACFEDWGQFLERWPEDNDIDWYVLGRVCMTQGAVEQAIGCFDLSLEHKDKLDAVERIQVVLWLASILRKNGQPDRSRQVLDEIDARFIDQAAGFRVAKAKASAAAAEGELARAEGDLEMLEQQQAEALGVTDISTVDTVQQLAGTLEQMGKMEEAQALYRRVWLSCQSLFGLNHPTTLAALEDLARISLESHAIDEAEALYQQAVDISVRTLGREHPNTAHAILKLALIDDIRCRYDSAKVNYERALQTLEGLGKANPTYTAAAENYALSSRWHGHSLDEDADGDLVMRSPSPSSTTSSDNNTIRATTMAAASMPPPPNIRSTRAIPHTTTPFTTAESLYLSVLSIKISARDLYTEADIMDTASKLSEMYESESFFENLREEKGKELRRLLRGVISGRRRAGDGRTLIRGMSSSLSEKSVENWR
jgi:tetratricopeptide (TPR) repeat protein